MSKEEDFYLIRSNAITSLMEFIKSCNDNGRDITEELNEILWEAQDECGVKNDDKKQLF